MHLGKPPDQTWSAYIRQVLAFLLGGAVIIHAIATPNTQIAQWIIGLLLMGIVPVDAVVSRFRKSPNGEQPPEQQPTSQGG